VSRTQGVAKVRFLGSLTRFSGAHAIGTLVWARGAEADESWGVRVGERLRAVFLAGADGVVGGLGLGGRAAGVGGAAGACGAAGAAALGGFDRSPLHWWQIVTISDWGFSAPQ
jgi:hypothetical protein